MNDLFRGMEYVYTVYKEKSFSAAAKKLYISQPSLSANVKRVENRIGYPIFDRSTKPLSLTECGENYIRSVEQILAVQEDFANFLSDWEQLKTGSLTIGGTSLYASQVLPSMLRRFSRRYPRVQVSLTEGNSTKLYSMLDSGDLDIIIDNSALDSEVYDSLLYKDERLFLAVPSKFEINRSLTGYQIPADRIAEGPDMWQSFPIVPLSAFENEPFVFLTPGNDTGRRSALMCHNEGFVPNVLFTLDQQMTSYQITRSGLAISFISDTLISRIGESERVIYYCLDPAHSSRKLNFYWKKARYISRAMSEFIKMIR